VELPAAVRRPFEVFVNGVPQVEGTDFEVVGSTLLFERELQRERKLAPWRWLLLFLGVWSSYRHFDTIDVVHTVDGRRVVATLTPVDGGAAGGAGRDGRYAEG
jgi:hypothetical protein